MVFVSIYVCFDDSFRGDLDARDLLQQIMISCVFKNKKIFLTSYMLQKKYSSCTNLS